MRKKNFKGRCEKRKLPKCEDVCRTFDAIQFAYADLLNGSEDIKSFRVNVLLDGMDGGYTSDFVCVKADRIYQQEWIVVLPKEVVVYNERAGQPINALLKLW